MVKRSKPLKYAYEKEIVLYAHHAKLTYFSTECIYSPAAFRGTARTLLKDLERIRPESILDIVRSGEDMAKLCPGYVDDCACDEDEGGGEATAGCGGGASERAEQERKEWEGLKRVGDGEGMENRRESVASVSTSTSSFKKVNGKAKPPRTMGACEKCGYLSSQSVCQACQLLEGLNKSKPKVAIESSPEETAATLQNLSLGTEI
jgi:cytoplasmic tRNA 2-thiolation protein 1